MRSSALFASLSIPGAFALVAACTASTDGKAPPNRADDSGVVMKITGPDGAYDAPHAPFPVVTYQGGPLVTAPEIVTVTFPNDTLAPTLAAFGQGVASSAWWDAVRADYCATNGTTCVGDGPAGVSVAVPTAPATSFTDSAEGGPASLQTYIAGLIGAGTLPTPDANTIYVFYFAADVQISLDGGITCQDLFGYHNAMQMGQIEVHYAVVSECPPDENISVTQNTTSSAAHEIIETATDPSNDAFSFYLDLSDPRSWGWNDIEGGEVADLCVDPLNLGGDLTLDGPYEAQRVWSTKNAALGVNPCIPIPAGEVYFNAAPIEPVLAMDVGKSATIELDAFSDAPMAAWTLAVEDWTDLNTPYLEFAIAGGTNDDADAETQVTNGAKVQLTVTLLADPADTVNGEADAMLISANGSEETATTAHYWPLVVMTTAEAKDAGIVTSGKKRHPRRARGR